MPCSPRTRSLFLATLALALAGCGRKDADDTGGNPFALSDAARGACYDSCETESLATDCDDDPTGYLNDCRDQCAAVVRAMETAECLEVMADHKACMAAQSFHCEPETYGDLRLRDDGSQCSESLSDYIDCLDQAIDD